MSFDFSPMTEADARAILSWRYDGPYAAYNAPDVTREAYADALRELLDPHSPYCAAREHGEPDTPPIGFFAYGSSCEVGAEETRGIPTPYLLRPDGSLTIGLGLRPDLTGHGRGLALVEAGLAYARAQYDATLFRLYVFAWNQRAIRVYERAGFTPVGEARVTAPEGDRVFIEMTRPV